MIQFQSYTKTLLADLYTPVGIYMRLRDLYPQSALMESSDYHDASNSSSFIGIYPLGSVAISHGKAILSMPDGATITHTVNNTYRCDNAINQFIHAIKVTGDGSQYCGLYGYTAFNAVRYFENIAVKDTTMQKNDAPDMLYILYRDIIVFDHFNNKMTLVTLVPQNNDAEAMKVAGEEALHHLETAINRQSVKPYAFHPVGNYTSPLTDEEHKANIRRGIQHCLRGDVFQIVISRRFIQRYEGDDFKLYRALRSINPSPYLFYFDFGGFRIFGSSPETHCRIENRRLTSTPSQAPHVAQAMPKPIDEEPNICATTPKKTLNT